MIKKIGILTSGGDAPGMNTCVVAAIRAGINHGKDMFVVYEGYKGLIDGTIEKVDKNFMLDHASHGGTYIGSARCDEFRQPEYQKKAADFLKSQGIDAMVILGGDGSFMGAKKLHDLGINCVCIPCTIDGDINCSDYTVGLDTALNTIVSSLDNIRETNTSHSRCAVVEVMGNACSVLTDYSSLATFADFRFTRENWVSMDDAVKKVKEFKEAGNKNCIVVVSEKFIDTRELTTRLDKESGYVTRMTQLGHIQRGGRPTAYERTTAVRLAVHAVRLLDEGKSGLCLGTEGDKIVYRPIDEALAMPRKDWSDYIECYKEIR